MPGFVSKDIARQIEDELLDLAEMVVRKQDKITTLIEIGGGVNAVFQGQRRGSFKSLYGNLNTLRRGIDDNAQDRPDPPDDPPPPPEPAP